MLKIKVEKKEKDVVKLEAKGHAGYAEYGKDIVCSAASAIIQTALLGIKDVDPLNVEYVVDDKKGYLLFTVGEPDGEENRIKQQAILRAMILGLRDLESGYGSMIKLEVK